MTFETEPSQRRDGTPKATPAPRALRAVAIFLALLLPALSLSACACDENSSHCERIQKARKSGMWWIDDPDDYHAFGKAR